MRLDISETVTQLLF